MLAISRNSAFDGSLMSFRPKRLQVLDLWGMLARCVVRGPVGLAPGIGQ